MLRCASRLLGSAASNGGSKHGTKTAAKVLRKAAAASGGAESSLASANSQLSPAPLPHTIEAAPAVSSPSTPLTEEQSQIHATVSQSSTFFIPTPTAVAAAAALDKDTVAGTCPMSGGVAHGAGGSHSSVFEAIGNFSNIKKLVLLRNGEHEANVDVAKYCSIPDWRIDLTEKGKDEAHNAGIELATRSDGDPIFVYFSPYLRSNATMQLLLKAGSIATPAMKPLNIIGVREDSRLRDGDIGRFTGVEELQKCLAEREEYGKFFYRFPHGESGADVCDRVSSFLDAFQREQQQFPPKTTVLLVTHGLTIRMLVKRWFHLNVNTFHNMTSPPPGKCVDLECLDDGHCFKLSNQSVDYLSLPKSLTESNGYAYRNKKLFGSLSLGAPYV